MGKTYFGAIGGKNKKENLPKYYCSSCTKCVRSTCLFYNRRVDPKYNRCFNHSNYHTVATQYKSPCNIADIAEENYKRYIA